MQYSISYKSLHSGIPRKIIHIFYQRSWIVLGWVFDVYIVVRIKRVSESFSLSNANYDKLIRHCISRKWRKAHVYTWTWQESFREIVNCFCAYKYWYLTDVDALSDKVKCKITSWCWIGGLGNSSSPIQLLPSNLYWNSCGHGLDGISKCCCGFVAWNLCHNSNTNRNLNCIFNWKQAAVNVKYWS